MEPDVDPLNASQSGARGASIALILRDIARAGIAGLLVGVLVGGVGGRVAMRLAALAVPFAEGSATENGNRIGDITLGGTLSLVIVAGLFAGIFLAVVWVVVSPWMPRSLPLRAIIAVPLAIALGSFGVIQADNVDFIVLQHNPLVVGLLLVLVGFAGAAMAVVDAGLERVLPRVTSVGEPIGVIYGFIAVPGLLFLPGVIATYLLGDGRPAGIPLLFAGFATLRWWYLRSRGADRPPDGLGRIGRGGVLAAVMVGLAVAVPEIAGALDFP